MMWVGLAIAPLAAGVAAGSTGAAPIQATIDFEEGLAAGDIVSALDADTGISGGDFGTVEVFGERSDLPGINQAMIFGATCGGSAATCSGEDPDLYQPELGEHHADEQHHDEHEHEHHHGAGCDHVDHRRAAAVDAQHPSHHPSHHPGDRAAGDRWIDTDGDRRPAGGTGAGSRRGGATRRSVTTGDGC